MCIGIAGYEVGMLPLMFVQLGPEVYCLNPTSGECHGWVLEVNEYMLICPLTWLVYGLDAAHCFG